MRVLHTMLERTSRRLARRCIAFALCASLVGCGEFRGIPTHGGGKRFDEEQRVVASTIRKTLADVDLAELSGKRVQINVETIATDGGGTAQFPGLASIGAGINGNVGAGNGVQVIPNLPSGGSYQRNDNRNNNLGGNVGIGISPMTTYAASGMSSQQDVGYFRAALEMKARHVGVTVVSADCDAVLYVLIDVLGTNRSHTDRIVASGEQLSASCDCTYYATNAKTGKLIFEARQASSEAVYSESRILGAEDATISRRLLRTPPLPLPVDEPNKPTTRPTPPTEVAGGRNQ